MNVRGTLVALFAITISLAVLVFSIGDDEFEPSAPSPAELDPLAFDDGERIELEAGSASLTCGFDHDAPRPAGTPIGGVTYTELRERVRGCVSTQLVHLYYTGSMNAGVTRLVAAVTSAAVEVGVRGRLLDADSKGGDIAAAMRAGELMSEHGWAMWVARGSSCYSACTMLLAAAHYRAVRGDVGIHRVFPAHSTATSREELAHDLERILGRIRDYLMRHGVSTQLADAMMTVPAREIRVLTDAELAGFGLVGQNAAQADLERIQLVQRCGMAFVRRAEAWEQAHAEECVRPYVQRARETDVSPRRFECAILECGRKLEPLFGFPDPECPAESPIFRTSSWHFCEDNEQRRAQAQ